MGHGTDGHRGGSYSIRVTKTGCTITRMKSHMKTTPIPAIEYLRNKVSKANRTQTDNKPNELIGHFAQLHNQENWNKMEMEGKDTGPRTIQSPMKTNTDHTKAIRQNSNRRKERQEHHKHMHNEENYTTMRLKLISRKPERLC